MGFVRFFPHPYLTWCASSVHYTGVRPQMEDSDKWRIAGRNAGIATFGLVVSAFIALWSAQICLQVWWPTFQPASKDSAPLTCEAGTLLLVDAIEQATLQASEQSDEAAALRVFRSGLSEAWNLRPYLNTACQGDKPSLQLLREVDHLRYSEEHAVRYRATDLTKRRRDVARLLSARAQSTESALHRKANP